MARIDTSVRLESDGPLLWIKIGDHCRALLSSIEEDQLRDWLNLRYDAQEFQAPPPIESLTLKATRIYA